MTYDENKFREFNRMLTFNTEAVIIDRPEVLGDDYLELVENLNRLADSGKYLVIAPRDLR
jgi:hypothetical protein